MPFLSIHTLVGDSEDLLQKKRQHMDPVVSQLAPEYGAIMSLTAKGRDGLTTVNIWDSREGAQAFTQRPEVQQAQARSGLPQPATFESYTELDIHEYRKMHL